MARNLQPTITPAERERTTDNATGSTNQGLLETLYLVLSEYGCHYGTIHWHTRQFSSTLDTGNDF